MSALLDGVEGGGWKKMRMVGSRWMNGPKMYNLNQRGKARRFIIEKGESGGEWGNPRSGRVAEGDWRGMGCWEASCCSEARRMVAKRCETTKSSRKKQFERKGGEGRGRARMAKIVGGQPVGSSGGNGMKAEYVKSQLKLSRFKVELVSLVERARKSMVSGKEPLCRGGRGTWNFLEMAKEGEGGRWKEVGVEGVEEGRGWNGEFWWKKWVGQVEQGRNVVFCCETKKRVKREGLQDITQP